MTKLEVCGRRLASAERWTKRSGEMVSTNLRRMVRRVQALLTAAFRNGCFGGLLAVWHRELSKVRTGSEPWCSKADSVGTVSMAFVGSFDFG